MTTDKLGPHRIDFNNSTPDSSSINIIGDTKTITNYVGYIKA